MECSDDAAVAAKAVLKRALQALAALVRPHHGKPPLLDEWVHGRFSKQIDRYKDIEDDLSGALARLTMARRSKQAKAVRAWATTAPLKVTHAVTKGKETASRHTASASKAHLGEMTAQQAADKGLAEWSRQWLASVRDHSADILDAVERVYALGPAGWAVFDDGTPDEMRLPPIDVARIRKWARRFRGDTGRGSDGLRPRHIALLSDEALEALVMLLQGIEADQRWPSTLRGVAAVALAKKVWRIQAHWDNWGNLSSVVKN